MLDSSSALMFYTQVNSRFFSLSFPCIFLILEKFRTSVKFYNSSFWFYDLNISHLNCNSLYWCRKTTAVVFAVLLKDFLILDNVSAELRNLRISLSFRDICLK